MFTGLIQGVGLVEAIAPHGKETRLAIRPQFALSGYAIGESIAVNGVCLTVEEDRGGAFWAYASAETMGVTNLGRLARGHRVNLERALAMGDRLGGHLVSGHVDCLATVAAVSPAGQSRQYRLTFPAQLGAYVVDKGSVALDGISLTVNQAGADWLTVNIIPETQRQTTILGWSPGQAVNMEADVIGKYVAKMMGAWAAKGAQSANAADAKAAPSGITEDFLRSHGF